MYKYAAIMNINASSKLKDAASLALVIEKKESEIELLSQRLQNLLKELSDNIVHIRQPIKKREVNRAIGKSPRVKAVSKSTLAGIPRPVSPSGPLAPAVVKVLQRNGRAMKVKEILIDLEADGYVWTSRDPRQSLAVRIGKLRGVEKMPDGLYGTTIASNIGSLNLKPENRNEQISTLQPVHSVEISVTDGEDANHSAGI